MLEMQEGHFGKENPTWGTCILLGELSSQDPVTSNVVWLLHVSGFYSNSASLYAISGNQWVLIHAGRRNR